MLLHSSLTTIVETVGRVVGRGTMKKRHHVAGLADVILIACIAGCGNFEDWSADDTRKSSTVDAPQSAEYQEPASHADSTGISRWTGQGDSDRWLDAANWDPGVPAKHDKVVIENTNSGTPIVIDDAVEVGMLTVELPQKTDRLLLEGAGILALNGWEVSIPGKGKYGTALITTGILDIGPDLTFDIRHQRFTVGNMDGTTVIRSNRVRAGIKTSTSKSYHSDGDKLKFAITDRGRIVIATSHWEPGMSLDLSASHTEGPKIIEFVQDRGSQGVTFIRLKEHDGDPIEIHGFDDNDFIRFQADPFLSCDEGKEFRIDAVTFMGWPDAGAARIEQEDGYWYLKPKSSA